MLFGNIRDLVLCEIMESEILYAFHKYTERTRFGDKRQGDNKDNVIDFEGLDRSLMVAEFDLLRHYLISENPSLIDMLDAMQAYMECEPGKFSLILNFIYYNQEAEIANKENWRKNGKKK